MTGDDRQAAALVRDRVRASGTSFYWAMKLLPRAKQDAMFAIYAFCREVDDIADEPAPRADKIARLDGWRRELDTLYDGRPAGGDVIARALVAPIERFGLARADFDAIIDGVAMDAEGAIVAPSLDELHLYCARVAGAVGHHSIKVFGCSHESGPAYADATGLALQLTNILRDVDEDAARGRVYLPRELLAEAGIEAGDAAQILRHPGLPDACARLAARAEDAYGTAESVRRAMPRDQAATLRPAVIMTAIYRRLLARLRARGWRELARPVRVGAGEKFWLAARIALAGR